MKLRYYLLISCVVGLGAGYFLAPAILPAIIQALYGEKEHEKPVATAPVVVQQPKAEKPKPAQPAPDEPIAQTDEPDEQDIEEDADDDDPEGDTPKKLARYAPEDDGRRPVNEEYHIGTRKPTEWSNPKVLKNKLAKSLSRKLKGVDTKHVTEFLKDPETRLELSQWELLNRADIDGLSALMKDKETAKDLTPLLNDLRWISSFVYDGELCKSEVALAMLRHLRQSDPDMDKTILVEDTKQLAEAGLAAQKGLKARVAAAIAVEFTRQGWYGDGSTEMSEEELRNIKDFGYMRPNASRAEKRKAAGKPDLFRLARERYLYFAESVSNDLLNKEFGKLPDWLMHIVCGWKGNSPFGTASTMRWLRDNVSAPPKAYTGMCSQVPYRPTNLFGDSIHGPFYYEPYAPLYPGNFAKMTRDIGAVCGGLSHFGASSANSNGIPAVTCGEPGHCAYAVYVEGHWIPCNSISPDRRTHWPVWGEHVWSAMEMMTAMYENGARTRDAQMVATMAAVYESLRNPNKSLKLFELSVTMQPLNQPAWKNYIATAARSLSRNPRRWLGVNEFVCSAVAPEHPEMCAKFLLQNIYPSMLQTLRTPQQKTTAFNDYFSNLNVEEKAQWDITPLMDMQYESIGKNVTCKKKFFATVINSVKEHPEFGPALTWVVKASMRESKSVLRDTLKSVDAAMETCEKKELLAAAVIRAAEEGNDLDLFNKYSKPFVDAAGTDEKSDMPGFEPLPGNLISAGGKISIQTYHRDQSIITKHALALTEKGGHIRSDAAKHVKLVVELPKAQPIGGIVIIPRNGTGSYRVWKIESSMDGKEWKHLTDLPDSKGGPLIRLEWKSNYPKAKFLRIDSGEDQLIGIDFKAVLVYDNKKKH